MHTIVSVALTLGALTTGESITADDASAYLNETESNRATAADYDRATSAAMTFDAYADLFDDDLDGVAIALDDLREQQVPSV